MFSLIKNLFSRILCHDYFTPIVFLTITPSKDHVFVSVILTSTIFPIADLGPLKLTNLFFSVLPDKTSVFFLFLSLMSPLISYSLFFFFFSDFCFLIILISFFLYIFIFIILFIL